MVRNKNSAVEGHLDEEVIDREGLLCPFFATLGRAQGQC